MNILVKQVVSIDISRTVLFGQYDIDMERWNLWAGPIGIESCFTNILFLQMGIDRCSTILLVRPIGIDRRSTITLVWAVGIDRRSPFYWFGQYVYIQ